MVRHIDWNYSSYMLQASVERQLIIQGLENALLILSSLILYTL